MFKLITLISMLFLSSLSFGVPIYPKELFQDSIYPRDVQVFMNKVVDSKCMYSDHITGFFEDPIKSKGESKIYSTEIVLIDYDGSGWITVKKNRSDELELVNLDCPEFFIRERQ